MVVESSTGGDGVSCTGCIYTFGNGETKRTQCQCQRQRQRRRSWYDIASRLSRVVECIRYMALCKGWLLRSIKTSSSSSQCRRPWSDLPNDILISIASRLSRVECIRFMAVCKGWLHSIKPPPPPPRGGSGGHSHRLNHDIKPCLLVMEDRELGWLSLYTHPPFPNSKTNNNYKLRIPELEETFFRFSKDGWILLSKADLFNPRLFLWNMLTGAKFDLPDMDNNPNDFHGICFTSTPGSSDFMVVLIRSVSVERVTIFTYRPSTTDLKVEKKYWTEECYDNSSKTSFFGVSCNPVFYKEKLYCLDRYGHLGVFDYVRKNWTTYGDRPKYFVLNPPHPDDTKNYYEKPMSPAFCKFPYKSFMVDLEGEGLISVFVKRRKTEEVHIFRLDFCKMSWEEVDSLGMGELFVGLRTSISTIQVPYGSWNNLYFPGLKPNNHHEAYSLETKAYDPSCSTVWRNPLTFTWIELPISEWESTFYSKRKRN